MTSLIPGSTFFYLNLVKLNEFYLVSVAQPAVSMGFRKQVELLQKVRPFIAKYKFQKNG